MMGPLDATCDIMWYEIGHTRFFLSEIVVFRMSRKAHLKKGTILKALGSRVLGLGRQNKLKFGSGKYLIVTIEIKRLTLQSD